METFSQKARPREAAFAQLLGSAYRPGDDIDLVRSDGLRAVELKPALQGARDFHAAVLGLAMFVQRHPTIERATLVTSFDRMGSDRLRAEWDETVRALNPQLTRRLALAALTSTGPVAIPDDLEEKALLGHAQRVFRPLDLAAHDVDAKLRRTTRLWDGKRFEVWKVLLDAWLTVERPLLIREIVGRSGASYPIVAQVVQRLEREGELRRTRSGGAELIDLPRKTLDQVVVLAPQLRRTVAFRDATGRPPDLDWIAERIRRRRLPGLRLGGVVAARHYDPSFDLNGIPRLDILVDRTAEEGWWKAIDSALEPVESGQGFPVVLAHHTLRPPADDQPFASPSEVLLDLFGLRLHEQAEALIRRLRRQ